MITIERSSRLSDAILAKGMLDGLENYYPDFGYWYVNKCMPGILMGKDLLMVAKEHGQIIGVALAKKGADETKLRCVRVLPPYQNRGTGLRLIERTLRELNCDKPHCTVSEELMNMMSRPLVNEFGFSLYEVAKGRYRKNKLEYLFNQPPLALAA